MFGITYSLELCSNLELAFYSVVFVLSVSVIKWILKKLVGKFWDEKISYKTYCGLRRSLNIFTVAIMCLLWFDRIRGFLLFLGIAVAGLSILFKDVILNWICGVYIKNKKIFKIGDRIEYGECRGDVLKVTGFRTDILEMSNFGQETGGIVHIPHRKILKTHLKNFNEISSFVWDEIELTLPIGVDLANLKRELYGIVKEIDIIKNVVAKVKKQSAEAHNEFKSIYNNCEPMIYTNIRSEKVVLSLRYLIQPKKARYVSSMIYSQIYEMFKKDSDNLYKEDDQLL